MFENTNTKNENRNTKITIILFLHHQFDSIPAIACMPSCMDTCQKIKDEMRNKNLPFEHHDFLHKFIFPYIFLLISNSYTYLHLWTSRRKWRIWRDDWKQSALRTLPHTSLLCHQALQILYNLKQCWSQNTFGLCLQGQVTLIRCHWSPSPALYL